MYIAGVWTLAGTLDWIMDRLVSRSHRYGFARLLYRTEITIRRNTETAIAFVSGSHTSIDFSDTVGFNNGFLTGQMTTDRPRRIINSLLTVALCLRKTAVSARATNKARQTVSYIIGLQAHALLGYIFASDGCYNLRQ